MTNNEIMPKIQPKTKQKPGKNKKIVLVEDEKLLIQLYKEIFQKAGYQLQVLTLGTQALEMLQEIREGKREKVDLILLDLVLPDIDGLEILKQARQYPETRDLKIIALTNFTDPHLEAELIKEGIDRFLIKTEFPASKLIPLVNQVLEESKE